jgi:hypothetical protein
MDLCPKYLVKLDEFVCKIIAQTRRFKLSEDFSEVLTSEKPPSPTVPPHFLHIQTTYQQTKYIEILAQGF